MRRVVVRPAMRAETQPLASLGIMAAAVAILGPHVVRVLPPMKSGRAADRRARVGVAEALRFAPPAVLQHHAEQIERRGFALRFRSLPPRGLTSLRRLPTPDRTRSVHRTSSPAARWRAVSTR